MNPDMKVLFTVLLVIGMVALAVILRRLTIVEESHSKLFSRLVTHVTLPALVFGSLAQSQFDWSEGLMALMLFASGVV